MSAIPRKLRPLVDVLFARWRFEPHEQAKGQRAVAGGMAVCPVCRHPERTLGVGLYPNGEPRAWCWPPEGCGAMEEQVFPILELPLRRWWADPWSVRGMIARLDKVIAELERDLGVRALRPPEIRVPAIRAPGE